MDTRNMKTILTVLIFFMVKVSYSTAGDSHELDLSRKKSPLSQSFTITPELLLKRRESLRMSNACETDGITKVSPMESKTPSPPFTINPNQLSTRSKKNTIRQSVDFSATPTLYSSILEELKAHDRSSLKRIDSPTQKEKKDPLLEAIKNKFRKLNKTQGVKEKNLKEILRNDLETLKTQRPFMKDLESEELNDLAKFLKIYENDPFFHEAFNLTSPLKGVITATSEGKITITLDVCKFFVHLKEETDTLKKEDSPQTQEKKIPNDPLSLETATTPPQSNGFFLGNLFNWLGSSRKKETNDTQK